jgi:hypothetical protein
VNFTSRLGGFFVMGHIIEKRVVSGEQDPGVKPKLRHKYPRQRCDNHISKLAVILFYERNRPLLDEVLSVIPP